MSVASPTVVWVLGAVEVALLVAALVVWLRTPSSRFTGNRWGWLAGICLVSVVGPTAFLLFGRRARLVDEATGPDVAKADEVTDLLYGPRS